VPALNAALDRLEADPQIDIVVDIGIRGKPLGGAPNSVAQAHHCSQRRGPLAAGLPDEKRHKRPSQFHLRQYLQ